MLKTLFGILSTIVLLALVVQYFPNLISNRLLQISIILMLFILKVIASGRGFKSTKSTKTLNGLKGEFDNHKPSSKEDMVDPIESSHTIRNAKNTNTKSEDIRNPTRGQILNRSKASLSSTNNDIEVLKLNFNQQDVIISWTPRKGADYYSVMYSHNLDGVSYLKISDTLESTYTHHNVKCLAYHYRIIAVFYRIKLKTIIGQYMSSDKAVLDATLNITPSKKGSNAEIISTNKRPAPTDYEILKSQQAVFGAKALDNYPHIKHENLSVPNDQSSEMLQGSQKEDSGHSEIAKQIKPRRVVDTRKDSSDQNKRRTQFKHVSIVRIKEEPVKKSISDMLKEIYGLTSIFHMTHVCNLNSILTNGFEINQSINMKKMRFTDISMSEVQRHREMIEPIYGRKVHQYAPCYINPRNPMLYKRLDIQELICILEIATSILDNHQFVFSDGNASSNTTCFMSDIDDLRNLPWDVLRSDFWHDKDDGKRKMCAECLVFPTITPKYIDKIHFYYSAPKGLFIKKDVVLVNNSQLYFRSH